MLCTVHNTLVHETHHYTPQGLDNFGLNISLLHISIHTTTYKVNSGTSLSCIQVYGSITLSVILTFLSLWLPLFAFNILFLALCM
jgi:uncharacterized membrane protein